MCGIVGYIGARNSQAVLLDGLSKLEYRGYDSAGIAVFTPDGLQVSKAQGRLAVLASRLEAQPLEERRHRAYALGDAREAFG